MDTKTLLMDSCFRRNGKRRVHGEFMFFANGKRRFTGNSCFLLLNIKVCVCPEPQVPTALLIFQFSGSIRSDVNNMRRSAFTRAGKQENG